MKYVDVHSHWTDLRFSQDPTEIGERLTELAAKGIDLFLLAGVDPQDWQRQIKLKESFPNSFELCFGLHPYFVAENPQEECERALDELAQNLPKARALGESGLDYRPHIMKDSETRQIEFFENQIDLANAFNLPMVLHIVQAHEKALQILDVWAKPQRGGLLHAFTGSYETAKKFIEKGFLISVGGAVTYERNKKLRDCIEKIPLEFLLLESDSPDQPPLGWEGQNNSGSLYKVAEQIALIKNISLFDVLEVNTGNFKRLFTL